MADLPHCPELSLLSLVLALLPPQLHSSPCLTVVVTDKNHHTPHAMIACTASKVMRMLEILLGDYSGCLLMTVHCLARGTVVVKA